jgi:hypothetical protein
MTAPQPLNMNRCLPTTAFAQLYSCILAGEAAPPPRDAAATVDLCRRVLKIATASVFPQAQARRKSLERGGLVAGVSSALVDPSEPEPLHEGDGWRLSHSTVLFTQEMQRWLNAQRERVLRGQNRGIVKFQALWRGYVCRRSLGGVLRVWHQIRHALAHALRAQFVQHEYAESVTEDAASLVSAPTSPRVNKLSGIDELNAVTSFMKTLHLLAARDGGRVVWAAERISTAAALQKAHIIAVMQAKHTLNQVTGQASEAKLTYAARDYLDLLSYALQEARRLDMQVLRHVYSSGMYAFDPLQDVDDPSVRYSMQTTPEYTLALRAFQTIRSASESLGARLKRAAGNQRVALELRAMVEAVKSLGLGVSIHEIEQAREVLDRLFQLRDAMEALSESSDVPRMLSLIDQTNKAGMQWPVVEQTRVHAVELQLKTILSDAMQSANLKHLAVAIKQVMDAVMEEGVRRKKRKQRRLRIKWIAKKKDRHLSEDEKKDLEALDEERDLIVNVDAELQKAQAQLQTLLDEQRRAQAARSARAGSSASSSTAVAAAAAATAASAAASPSAAALATGEDPQSVLLQLHQQQEAALNQALSEATMALDHLHRKPPATHASGATGDQLDETRRDIQGVLERVQESLLRLGHDIDARLRMRDVRTNPARNAELGPPQISQAELEHCVAQVQQALEAGTMFGLDTDIEALDPVKFAREHSEQELEDCRLVTELRNCLLELRSHLDEREQLLRQIRQLIEQASAEAHERSEDELEVLRQRVSFLLQNARHAVLDESDLQTLQKLYDALNNTRETPVAMAAAVRDALRDARVPAATDKPPQGERGESQGADQGRSKPATVEKDGEAEDEEEKKQHASAPLPPPPPRHFFPDSGADLPTLLSGSVEETKAPTHEQQLAALVGKATAKLSQLLDHLSAVSAVPDLSARPTAISPLRKNRVADAELLSLKSRLVALLQLSKDTASPKTAQQARRCLMEIDVHLEERARALSHVEAALKVAGRLPVSSAQAEGDATVSDEALVAAEQRLATSLAGARKIGVAEDELTVVQDTLDDVRVYRQGREETRAESRKLLELFRTLFKAHPLLFDAEAILAARPAEEAADEAAPGGAASAGEDAELAQMLELVSANLADCELGGLPSDEPAVLSLRAAYAAIQAYVTARSRARRLVFALAQRPVQMSVKRDITDALSLAKSVGLTADLSEELKLPVDRQPPLTRAIRELQRKIVELDERQSSVTLPAAQRSAQQRLGEVEELDKKLTRLVPEARRRLNAAIQSRDPKELAAAVQMAKDLELRLQKLRQFRRQLVATQ